MGKGKPSEIWKELKPRIGDMVTAANDMEQSFDKAVREAYQRGYETAKHECEDRPKQAYTDTLRMDVYQKGLSDAWEVARKVVALTTVDRREVFGSEYMYSILEKHTAAEAIEKIRQYEQEKEEKKDGVWIMDEVNEPNVNTTLICSKCGYVIKIKPHEIPALNFCPQCGDNKIIKIQKEGEA